MILFWSSFLFFLCKFSVYWVLCCWLAFCVPNFVVFSDWWFSKWIYVLMILPHFQLKAILDVPVSVWVSFCDFVIQLLSLMLHSEAFGLCFRGFYYSHPRLLLQIKAWIWMLHWHKFFLIFSSMYLAPILNVLILSLIWGITISLTWESHDRFSVILFPSIFTTGWYWTILLFRLTWNYCFSFYFIFWRQK